MRVRVHARSEQGWQGCQNALTYSTRAARCENGRTAFGFHVALPGSCSRSSPLEHVTSTSRARGRRATSRRPVTWAELGQRTGSGKPWQNGTQSRLRHAHEAHRLTRRAGGEDVRTLIRTRRKSYRLVQTNLLLVPGEPRLQHARIGQNKPENKLVADIINIAHQTHRSPSSIYH